MIVIYGRSAVVPKLAKDMQRARAQVASRPCSLFMDCLFLHRSGVAQAQSVYDALLSLDDSDFSGHFFEITTARELIYSCMGALLAHPLQRRQQMEQLVLQLDRTP